MYPARRVQRCQDRTQYLSFVEKTHIVALVSKLIILFSIRDECRAVPRSIMCAIFCDIHFTLFSSEPLFLELRAYVYIAKILCRWTTGKELISVCEDYFRRICLILRCIYRELSVAGLRERSTDWIPVFYSREKKCRLKHLDQRNWISTNTFGSLSGPSTKSWNILINMGAHSLFIRLL